VPWRFRQMLPLSGKAQGLGDRDRNAWTRVRPTNGSLRSRTKASQAALDLRVQLRRPNDGIPVVAPCGAVALLRLY